MLSIVYDIVRFYFVLGLVFANFAGYILLLWVARMLRPVPLPSPRKESAGLLPELHILVPVFNEAEHILKKLENLKWLDYPPSRKKVYVTDGGSTDGTLDMIAGFAGANPDFSLKLVSARQGGKIPQLNEALAAIPAGQLVIVSDADSLISPQNALQLLLNYFNDPETGLVGGWTIPSGPSPHRVELAFWDKENRMRYLETHAFSASIVLAPLYAFSRELINQFPTDCVADDVHLSFACHLKEKRVIYAPDIEVHECRQPVTLRQLFTHKLRKAHAYTTELLRYSCQLPYMRKRLKLIFLYKCFQFFYLPWIPIVLLCESLSLMSQGYFWLLLGSYMGLGASILAASATMVPPPNRSRGGLSLRSILPSVQAFVLINLVLVLNFLRFPFWRQTSSYAKTGTQRSEQPTDVMVLSKTG